MAANQPTGIEAKGILLCTILTKRLVTQLAKRVSDFLYAVLFYL
jgi:hypothetical protein